MRPYGYTSGQSQVHRPRHHLRISGMKTTGYIGRRYIIYRLFIQTQFISTEALPHITVQVNLDVYIVTSLV